MPDSLADSYEFCRKLTRRTATNFYYSFTGLPRDRFKAMCALYAYMRICDDIGDDESLVAGDGGHPLRSRLCVALHATPGRSVRT